MTGRLERWAWRVAALVALTAIVTSGVTAARQGFAASALGSTMTGTQPPCPLGRTVPVQDSPHIAQSAAASVHYVSSPPTSGPHFAFVAAPGIYPDPLPVGLAVHAMEHGHVVVWYGPSLGGADVAVLSTVARRYPADVLLTPYPKLAAGAAVTSWGCLEPMPAVDGARVEALVRALRDRYDHGWAPNGRHGPGS